MKTSYKELRRFRFTSICLAKQAINNDLVLDKLICPAEFKTLYKPFKTYKTT